MCPFVCLFVWSLHHLWNNNYPIGIIQIETGPNLCHTHVFPLYLIYLYITCFLHLFPVTWEFKYLDTLRWSFVLAYFLIAWGKLRDGVAWMWCAGEGGQFQATAIAGINSPCSRKQTYSNLAPLTESFMNFHSHILLLHSSDLKYSLQLKNLSHEFHPPPLIKQTACKLSARKKIKTK